MKKKLLLAAILLVGIGAASQAHAAAYDWLFNLNDDLGSPYTFTVDGTGSDPMVLMYRPGGHLPYLAPMNGGLQLNGSNQLVIDNIPQSEINGLVTDLGNINTSLSGKASASHTHVASDITNFNSAVDARIASTTLTMTFGTSTRALNTAFKISSTAPTIVTYTVDVATTLSLTGGATGTVTLEYADDSAFTTNVKTVQSAVNGNTGTLTIGLALTQTSTATVTGIIPANKWIRISTANTVGTPTFTYRMQQEVLLPLH